MILSAITSIISVISSAIKAWGEQQKLRSEVKLARLEAERQLALKTVEAQLELGRAQIQATGKFFKYFTFFMWFGPFMISAVFPAYGIMIFENLSQLPEWYTKSCTALMFAVWGIQVSRQYLDSMFSSISYHISRRQELKVLEKVVKSHPNNLSEPEVKLVDKTLRKKNGLGYTPL